MLAAKELEIYSGGLADTLVARDKELEEHAAMSAQWAESNRLLQDQIVELRGINNQLQAQISTVVEETNNNVSIVVYMYAI